jgi:AcrR family transcriptional regulator
VTNRRRDTRDELLLAGVRLYRQLSSGLLRGVTAGDVAAEAGFHRQTFYRYWDTQAAYVQDLMRHVLSTSPASPDGVRVLPDRRLEPGDPADLVRDIARFDYLRHAEDPAADLRIGVLTMQALADNEALADVAQAAYDRRLEESTEAFEDLLESWGLEPRPPLTTRDIARVGHALLTGFLLQERAARDEPSGGDLYEQVSADLLFSLTRKRQG